MSHMVIFRSVDGKPGFQQTDDLVSAVEFVERLRNAEGVESARIYRLEQISFRFQPYYQVHLDTDGAPTPPSSVVREAVAPAAPSSLPAAAAAVDPTFFGEDPSDPAPSAPLLTAPAVTAEAAPMPPPVPAAAMAAAASSDPSVADDPTAEHDEERRDDEPGVPSFSSAAPSETPEGGGIRRGLFGR